MLRCRFRRCVISGWDIVGLLEAADIRPYRGLADDNEPSNGLLLRCDLHTLFDLDLLGIEPETLTVRLREPIRRPPYADLDGAVPRLGPVVPSQRNLRRQFAERSAPSP